MLRVKNPGFTMVELMVAILIISILAAISGPVYRSYTAKAKFAVVLQEMAEYKDKLLDAYQRTDIAPEELSGLAAGDFIEPDSDVLEFIYFNGYTATNSAFLQGLTVDLGVSGYVAPQPDGSGCSFCRVTIAVMPTSTGHMQVYCGQWDGSDEDVPLTVLPSSCQDTNIQTTIS